MARIVTVLALCAATVRHTLSRNAACVRVHFVRSLRAAQCTRRLRTRQTAAARQRVGCAGSLHAVKPKSSSLTARTPLAQAHGRVLQQAAPAPTASTDAASCAQLQQQVSQVRLALCQFLQNGCYLYAWAAAALRLPPSPPQSLGTSCVVHGALEGALPRALG